MHSLRENPSLNEHHDDARSSRVTRRFASPLWSAFLALPVSLGIAVAPAAAAWLGSSAINADIAMPMGAWTTLNAVVVPANVTPAYCTAVGSADFNSPAAGVGTYLLTLTLDAPNPPINLGQERTVQFVPGGSLIREVSTTQGFALPAGAHLLRSLGRPAPGSPATAALDRSFSVVCDKYTLGIYNSNPEPLLD